MSTNPFVNLLPISDGGPVDSYSIELVKIIYGNQTRHNGQSVFHDHLAPVADDAAALILPSSSLVRVVRGAGYTHDIVEDHPEVLGALNPFAERWWQNRLDGVKYLNDLYEKAGYDGMRLCNIVRKMTRDMKGPKKLYHSYLDNLLTLPDRADFERYQDAVCAILLKLVDLGKNADVSELVYLMNMLSQKLAACTDDSGRESVADHYRRAQERITGNALNNLVYAFPKIEYVLLGYAKDGAGVFDPARLESFLADAYVDAYAITGMTPGIMKRVDMNRDFSRKMNTFGRDPIVGSLGKRIPYAQEQLAKQMLTISVSSRAAALRK